MKFERAEVWGFSHSLRGMRNPKNSWDRNDSMFGYDQWGTNLPDWSEVDGVYAVESPIIGKNDMELAQRLIKAGSEHRKFLRQIMVSVDITAPLYWWKEYDTYKVGTVANSTSTMHKLASTPITLACFETDDFDGGLILTEDIEWNNSIDDVWNELIDRMETLRVRFNKTKDKRYWKELIRLLPSSWLQTRTVTMNYENLYSMIRHRQNHKLTEWSKSFMEWVDTLPYSKEFIKCGMGENE